MATAELLDSDIEKHVDAFYKEMLSVENHRYRSWEHCFAYFRKIMAKRIITDEEIDTACLHLAFYLASWGMYRGSSFLLNRDYKVHEPIVREIIKDDYRTLWDINYDEVNLGDKKIELIFTLSKIIRKLYGREVSNILITKIFLGTFCCLPAYDNYFKDSIKEYGHFQFGFYPNHLMGMIDFYKSKSGVIKKCQETVSHDDIIYPAMKIVDMIFWQIGNDKYLAKKLVAEENRKLQPRKRSHLPRKITHNA
jgi:hypothetical protein